LHNSLLLYHNEHQGSVFCRYQEKENRVSKEQPRERSIVTNETMLLFIRDKNNSDIRGNAVSPYSDVSHYNSFAIQEILLYIHAFHLLSCPPI